jgi:hypothetical protein
MQSVVTHSIYGEKPDKGKISLKGQQATIGGCSTFHLVKVMKTVTGCQVFCKKNLVCVNFFTRVCQFFCSCVSIFLLTPTSRPQGDLFNSRPYILYSI